MDFESVNKDLFIYKIPLGHNRTNGAVYSKINFKVEISSAIQLGPKYERQLNSMAEPIPHVMRPLVRTHDYHPYYAADRQAETDSLVREAKGGL